MLSNVSAPLCPAPRIEQPPDLGPRLVVGPARRSDCAEAFQHGIQHLAGGVTVVTSGDDDGERFGVTTTSVCALGMTPPTLVACVRRRSKLGGQLPRTRRFCVNVLSHGQRSVADAFAGHKGIELDRFRHGRWTVGVSGSPVLDGALASFECAVDLLYAYPNHLIVVGTVEHATLGAAHGAPLLSGEDQLPVPA